MSYSHDKLKPYRDRLKQNATKDEIAWIFLQAICDLDEEIGIYYIFEKGKINDQICLSIVNKLSMLKLATKLDHEGGNKNYYMRIRNEGIYALENFNSLDEYEKYFTEKNTPKPTALSTLNITGNVVNSQVGQGSDFGNLESSHNSIALEPAIANAQPIETSKMNSNSPLKNIIDKIYKWTDHKLISGIILLIIGFFLSRIIAWLGWL